MNEERAYRGDEKGLDVLDHRVGYAVEDDAHQHHREDLTRLGQHLRREGDVLERLVLRPR